MTANKGWDLEGWFSTLMIRMALTSDEQERKDLMGEITTITDQLPHLRAHARDAGCPVLPDHYRAVNYEA